MNQQPAITCQTIPPNTPIDPKPIVEHCESPTAIILAITILLSSMTELVRVILVAVLRQTKPSR